MHQALETQCPELMDCINQFEGSSPRYNNDIDVDTMSAGVKDTNSIFNRGVVMPGTPMSIFNKGIYGPTSCSHLMFWRRARRECLAPPTC